MPGENVNFVAFGQQHTDVNALVAQKAHIESLHKELSSKGKTLVIGVEHSDVDLKKSGAIRVFHNRAVMQEYLEQLTPDELPPKKWPDYDTFFAQHGDRLKWKEQNPGPQRPYSETSVSGMKSLFTQQAYLCKNQVNMGKGPARIAEAALLDWASLSGIQVKGLDPVSDVAKGQALENNNGRINLAPLQAMEYERVQGMGKKSAELMKTISESGGGCLVAVNIGAAHLGSVEVALREELGKQDLEKAQVQMCVMVSPELLTTGEKPEKISDGMMRHTLQDMRSSHERMELRVGGLEKQVRKGEEGLKALKEISEQITKLPGTDMELRKLMNDDPGKVANLINSGLTGSKYRVEEEEIRECMANPENLQGDIREKLGEHVGADIPHIKEIESGLEKARQELSEAMAPFKKSTEEVFPFARKVEQRLDETPGDVFKTFTTGTSGQYDLSVLEKGPRTTVREALGKSGSKSLQSLNQPEQGLKGTDNSTGSQVKVGGTPPKAVSTTVKL